MFQLYVRPHDTAIAYILERATQKGSRKPDMKHTRWQRHYRFGRHPIILIREDGHTRFRHVLEGVDDEEVSALGFIRATRV